MVSSLENTRFCGIAGGGNAGFERLFCAGTCEVEGLVESGLVHRGAGEAIWCRDLGSPSPMATTAFRKRFHLLGTARRRRKMAFEMVTCISPNRSFLKSDLVALKPQINKCRS